LDFNIKSSHDPDMTIDFCIRQNKGKSGSLGGQTFLYPEPLAIPAAEVKIDYKAKRIKAIIFNYQDSLKESLLNFILIKPLKMILHKNKLYYLHASIVRKGDKCIIICGQKDSGKSTISLVLARHGFGILSDDTCFVKLKGNKVLLSPFPTKVGISSKLLNKHQDFKKHLVKNYAFGEKQRISLSHIYDANKRHYSDILFLLPRYSNRGKFRIRSVSRDEALAKLMRISGAGPWLWDEDPKGFSSIFFTLHTLINNARCFGVVYSDKTVGKIPHGLKRRISIKTS
jgi:hypothetical protein